MNLPHIVNQNQKIHLPTNNTVPLTRLNNAATTPPFKKTLDTVHTFLQTYGALHRGAGPNASQTYTDIQRAIETIRTFIHVPDTHTLLFTQNTSAAINALARIMHFEKDDVILTSDIEHTSNNLPWRYNTVAQVIEVNTHIDGSIDYTDLEQKAKQYSTRLKLITMTGASNQTGFVPDIPKLARIAHQYTAELFIDAAQLAPHREINMTKDGIDMLAFSAHKIYAPFGLGVLAVPTTLLQQIPIDPGGGSIDMIGEHDIVWAPETERHQTGTWNVVGIVALAESCRVIMETGWHEIVTHEQKLLRHLLQGLQTIPGITLHVPSEKYISEERIGTVPFNLHGVHHAKLATILEHEYGIETRAGTICNHRLVRRWFDISDEEQTRIETEIKAGNRLASYGIVRASIGIFNTTDDIDRLVNALQTIAKFGTTHSYIPQPTLETFLFDNNTSMDYTNVDAHDLNYDAYSHEQYDRDIKHVIPGWEDLHKKIEDVLKTYIQQTSEVTLLELGIGTGLTTERILQKLPNAHVTAIDFSDTMINGARNHLKQYDIHYIAGDFADISFKKNHYDIACSVIGIHHQHDEGKRHLFKKIHDALNPNGLFIFGDLMTYRDKHTAAMNNAKHFHHMVEQATDETSLKDWAYHHIYLNEPATLEDQVMWLHEAGFRDVKVVYQHFNTVLIIAEK